MTDRPLVGVLGAGGAVGAVLAHILHDPGSGRLRLGLRRREPFAAPSDAAGVETMIVDVTRAYELAAFCAGCDVVVNCVGPLAGARLAVPAAVQASGSDYVDAGGDDGLRRDLHSAALRQGRRAIVGAGVLPGLSGLIPRWLASSGLTGPRVLTGYVATWDRMTRASAVEFLLGLRDSARVRPLLSPQRHHDLAFFPGSVTAFPHVNSEVERVAGMIGLDEVRWYHVFETDGRTLATLSRLQEELRRGGSADLLAGKLMRAVALDMFGRSPTQQLLVQLEGTREGRPAARSVMLRASSSYDLTATVAALAVAALTGIQVPAGMHVPPRARVPPGAHLAAEVLDPALITALPGRRGMVALELLEESVRTAAQLDQGLV